MAVVDLMAILVTVVWVLMGVSEVLLEVRGRTLLLTIEHVRLLLRMAGVVHGHAIIALTMVVLMGVVWWLTLREGVGVSIAIAVRAGVAIATGRLKGGHIVREPRGIDFDGLVVSMKGLVKMEEGRRQLGRTSSI